MSAVAETMMRADNLWPRDRFRRGGQVLEALHVAVSSGVPVVVTAREITALGTAAAREQFTIDADELLRVVPS